MKMARLPSVYKMALQAEFFPKLPFSVSTATTMLVPTTMQASHVSRSRPFFNRGLLHSKTLTNRHHVVIFFESMPQGCYKRILFCTAGSRVALDIGRTWNHISLEERT